MGDSLDFREGLNPRPEKIHGRTGIKRGHTHDVRMDVKPNGKVSGMTSKSAGHKHRIRLTVRDGKIAGRTNQNKSHKHTLDLAVEKAER